MGISENQVILVVVLTAIVIVVVSLLKYHIKKRPK
jgi:hypothetical protein